MSRESEQKPSFKGPFGVKLSSSTRPQHSHSFCSQTSAEMFLFEKAFCWTTPSPSDIAAELFSCRCFPGGIVLFPLFNSLWCRALLHVVESMKKNNNKQLKQSWLPTFWKKRRSKNTSEIKRTLFNWTKQDKTCTFSRKSSFSSYVQHKNRKTNN